MKILNKVLTDDDSDLMDSVYLPSKYPVISVLPDYNPDSEICVKTIAIAESVYKFTVKLLKEKL